MLLLVLFLPTGLCYSAFEVLSWFCCWDYDLKSWIFKYSFSQHGEYLRLVEEFVPFGFFFFKSPVSSTLSEWNWSCCCYYYYCGFCPTIFFKTSLKLSIVGKSLFFCTLHCLLAASIYMKWNNYIWGNRKWNAGWQYLPAFLKLSDTLISAIYMAHALFAINLDISLWAALKFDSPALKGVKFSPLNKFMFWCLNLKMKTLWP